MLWEIPKKISLLAVAILFLFTFFTLILDAPRTGTWLFQRSRVSKTELFDRNEQGENVGKNGTCLEVFDKLVSVVAGAVTVAADVLYVDTVLPKVNKLKVKR
jgi:hypothetical protein